jgi:hypothetical protein
MVHCLQENQDFALEISQFGRIFSEGETPIVKTSFNFRTESRSRCSISLRSLRFTNGTVDELVEAHIENRVDLLCTHGHEFVKTGCGSAIDSHCPCFTLVTRKLNMFRP